MSLDVSPVKILKKKSDKNLSSGLHILFKSGATLEGKS